MTAVGQTRPSDGLRRMTALTLQSGHRQDHLMMSQMCQTPTYAVQQNRKLFDDLVGAGEQCRRDVEAECLGRGQVYDEIEFGRLLDRQIARLRPA